MVKVMMVPVYEHSQAMISCQFANILYH